MAALVLVDKEHWSRRVPVWDTLRALAAERPMADAIHLVDDADDACRTIERIGSTQRAFERRAGGGATP